MSDERSKGGRDEYEAKNIAGSGEILHRDKVVSRMTAFACLGLAAFFTLAAIGGLAQGAPIAAGIGVGAVALGAAFLGLTRSVLRTVVTRTDVRIHWGLWGPRIALASITGLRTRPASRSEMVTAASEPGKAPIEIFQIPVPGDVLEIEWTDATGKARRAWVGAADAASLGNAIRRAASTAGARIAEATGARIAVASDETATEAAAVDDAALAEEDARAAGDPAKHRAEPL